MKNRLFSSRGSILMETALVIPLYLLVLSGIFWVGDLALLRSKSTFFDRFAAWSAGNRHAEGAQSAIRGNLEQNFLQQSRVGDQKVDDVRTAHTPSSVWSAIAGGTTTVSVKPPVWTEGWRRSGEAMTNGGTSGGNAGGANRTSFRSREGVNAEFFHRTLMRTADTYRDEVRPDALAEKLEWRSRVYMAQWPEEWTKENSAGGSGGHPCLKYERHNAYVQWSE